MINNLKNFFRKQHPILTPLTLLLFFFWYSRPIHLNEYLWSLICFTYVLVYAFKFKLKKNKDWTDYYRIFVVVIVSLLLLFGRLTKKSIFMYTYFDDYVLFIYIFAYLYTLGLLFSVFKFNRSTK